MGASCCFFVRKSAIDASFSLQLRFRPTGRIGVAGTELASVKRTPSLSAAGVNEAVEVNTVGSGIAAASAFPWESLSESPSRVKVESCSRN